MNILEDILKIPVVPKMFSFELSFKEASCTLISDVVVHRICRQEFLHKLACTAFTVLFDNDMEMVGHLAICSYGYQSVSALHLINIFYCLKTKVFIGVCKV